jgi:hypothetical protein
MCWVWVKNIVIRYLEYQLNRILLLRARTQFTFFYIETSEPYKNVVTVQYSILIGHWSRCDNIDQSHTHYRKSNILFLNELQNELKPFFYFFNHSLIYCFIQNIFLVVSEGSTL